MKSKIEFLLVFPAIAVCMAYLFCLWPVFRMLDWLIPGESELRRAMGE